MIYGYPGDVDVRRSDVVGAQFPVAGPTRIRPQAEPGCCTQSAVNTNEDRTSSTVTTKLSERRETNNWLLEVPHQHGSGNTDEGFSVRYYSHETGWEECPRNDHTPLLCVDWDVKPQLSQFKTDEEDQGRTTTYSDDSDQLAPAL